MTLLNKIYDEYDYNATEVEEIKKFRAQFAPRSSIEEKFNAAIEAARFAGFKDGFHAGLQLLSEINGGRN